MSENFWVFGLLIVGGFTLHYCHKQNQAEEQSKLEDMASGAAEAAVIDSGLKSRTDDLESRIEEIEYKLGL